MKVNKKSPDTQDHLDRVKSWNKMNRENDLRFHYPHLNKNSVVIDLGAYVGSWSEEILKRYGCTVHAFEPLPGFFFQAYQKLSKYPNGYVHQFAVGDSDRKEKLSFFEDGSTFFIAGGQEIEVTVRDFLKVLKETRLSEIGLIKMNVEGSEYEILEKLIQNSSLSISKSYQIQFHREISNHQERRKSIQESLRQSGFVCDYNVDWVWESWTRSDI